MVESENSSPVRPGFLHLFDSQSKQSKQLLTEEICLLLEARDGSVSKMCTSGGRQCKTVPNSGLRVLVHPK